MFVSIDLLGPIELNLPFAQKLSKYLMNPYKQFLTFVKFNKTKKRGQNFSSLERLPSIFQKFCFQQPFGSQKKDPMASTVKVRRPCGRLSNYSLMAVTLNKARKQSS